jgi:hypothetical protein
VPSAGKDHFDTVGVEALEPEAAFVEYITSCVAALGQLAILPEDSQAAMFSSLVDYAGKTESLAGLEGPFLSGVSGLAHGVNEDVLNMAADMLASVGFPPVHDGGALTACVFDSVTGHLAFPGFDSLAAVFDIPALGSSLRRRRWRAGSGWRNLAEPVGLAGRARWGDVRRLAGTL